MRSIKAPKATRAKTRNPVAKHARGFNKAQVHIDRKKAVKRGYVRCKSGFQCDSKAA